MNNDNSNSLTLLLTALGVGLMMLFGVWGLYCLPFQTQAGGFELLGAFYNSLKPLTFGDNYDSIMNNKPLIWQLQVSRWLGALVSFSAVYKILISVFSGALARARAGGFSGHITIIGKTAFTDALANRVSANKGPSQKCLYLRGTDQGEKSVGDTVFLPFLGLENEMVRAVINNARKIIIDADDDATAAQLTLSAQKLFPQSDIVTRMNDIWLARTLQGLPGGGKLRAFSEAEGAAREIVRRHFPFLIAEDLGQTRIHALLIGSYDWVEALIIEIILSTRTIKMGKPAFSVFTNSAKDFRARLLARYPEIMQEGEIAFFELEEALHPSLRLNGIPVCTAREPITCVYCAFDDVASSFTAAIALKDQALHDPGFKAPIFARFGDGDGLETTGSGHKLQENELIPFGTLQDIIKSTDIISIHADQAERAWHEVYLKTANPKKPASKPWAELDEEYRISNRRAVAHIYAKLFEAGINLRPFMASGKYWDELPKLGAGKKLFNTPIEREKLALLEHERWNADRRLQGWTYGKTRDDKRKIHDNLCDFSELSEDIQGHDLAFVDDLAERLLDHNNS